MWIKYYNCHLYFTDEYFFQSSSHGESRLGWFSGWPFFLLSPHFLSNAILTSCGSFLWWFALIISLIHHAYISSPVNSLIFHHFSKVQFQSSSCKSPWVSFSSLVAVQSLPDLFLLHMLSLEALSPNYLKVIFPWILYNHLKLNSGRTTPPPPPPPSPPTPLDYSPLPFLNTERVGAHLKHLCLPTLFSPFQSFTKHSCHVHLQ